MLTWQWEEFLFLAGAEGCFVEHIVFANFFPRFFVFSPKVSSSNGLLVVIFEFDGERFLFCKCVWYI